MINIGLIDFFKLLNYDWKADASTFKNICYYTKSRVNNNKKNEDFDFGYGMEQPFVLKAIAQYFQSKSFFEIGTGRGTGCYAVATAENIKKLSTVDIVPHRLKKNEAIGYEPAYVSNLDLFNMIESNGKQNIEFYERNQYTDIIKNKPPGGYDLFFIDGNHTDPDVISEDFLMCKLMFGNNPIIVWDDYYPDKFAIKQVVETTLMQNKDLRAFVVNIRGHLFSEKSPEENCGMVFMAKEKTYENILSKSK